MELPRSARATRGQRLSKLLDEEAEADNVFWGQDAFQEERADHEYEAEAEVADEFDSDFDEEEPESEDGEAQEEKEVKKKKKLAYKGVDKKRKSVSFLLGSAAIPRLDKSKSKKKASRPKPPKEAPAEAGDEENEERTIRKSTRTAVVSKQAARDAKKAQTLPKPVKRKKGEERKMSQEEMLLEGAQTEVLNLQSLERMLAREEEVKKKAIVQKTVYTGPQVRFISKNGCNILEFTKTNAFPSTINSRPKPYPEQALCVVTGLPAKYKDPRTGFAYATKEAFRVLRERCVNKLDKPGVEEIHQRKRSRVETERANRAGVARLRFKRSLSSGSGKDFPSPTTPQQQQQQGQASPLVLQQLQLAARPFPKPASPVAMTFEPADEADFPLDDLDVKFGHTYDSATQSWRFEPDEARMLDGHVMDTLCRRTEPRESHTEFSLFDDL